MTDKDFQITFKFSPDKKWAVLDIETRSPFDGKILSEILTNLALTLEQEPTLNELQNTVREPVSNGEATNIGDSGENTESGSDDTGTEADQYCGAV